MSDKLEIGQRQCCLFCRKPATQYFTSSLAYPLCGRFACEAKLVDEINEQLTEAAAEAASGTQGD